MQARQGRWTITAAAAVVVATALLLAGARYWQPELSASVWPAVGGTDATELEADREQTYYKVEVDGSLVGYVTQPDIVERALANAQTQVPAEAQGHVDLRGRTRVTPVAMRTGQSPIMSPEPIIEKLLALVPALQPAWAIRVEGRDVVAVHTRAEAEAVIQELKDDYQNTVLKGAASIEQIQILERIEFHQKFTLPDLIRNKDQAKEVLRFGTDKRILYTVQRGDTLWGIATSRGLSVEDLAKANPEINPDRLQIGQQISVTYQEPYVHLESSEIQVYNERIPFAQEWGEDPNLWPWQTQITQYGQYGQKQVTVRIHRKDGREVSRTIVDVQVLSQPRKQVGVRGSKMAPDLGSGQLYWPAQGTLTSGFGLRWGRLHAGIDIAAPRGTPVYAADNGTVTFAGRKGDYGNCIIIDHGGGRTVTLYGHLSRINVALGQQVNKGQVIGEVGNTGRSTGSHLHFEVQVNGRAVNPLKFYP